MTTTSTSGLCPTTIQKLRDEFREQYSELVKSSGKGWPACLPPGGASPRSDFDMTSSTTSRLPPRPPTPLYFNWTDDGLPPAPPGYTPVDLETGAKVETTHAKAKPCMDEVEEEDEEDDYFEGASDDSSRFASDKDEEEETKQSSKYASSVAQSSQAVAPSVHSSIKSSRTPPLRSNVFNFGPTDFQSKQAKQAKQAKQGDCKDIAGCVVDHKMTPAFPDIDAIADRYASNRNLNNYLCEHVDPNWIDTVKTKEFGAWLKTQNFLWSAFSSTKPDEVYTVFRLYTKQLPARSCALKTKPKQAKQEDIMVEEESYGSDSEMTDEQSMYGTESSYATGTQPSKQPSKHVRHDDQSELAMKAEAKAKAILAARERNRQRRDACSESLESMSLYSDMSENKQPTPNVKTRAVQASYLKPTAASLRKNATTQHIKKVPTTLNTSMHPKREIAEKKKPTISQWAKQTSKRAIKASKEQKKKFPLVESSPLLRNRRFGDGAASKHRTEHQTNFNWKQQGY